MLAMKEHLDLVCSFFNLYPIQLFNYLEEAFDRVTKSSW